VTWVSDPEARAMAARARLGLGAGVPIRNLLEVVEIDAGIPVIVERLGSDGLAGAYMVRRGRPFILINASSHLVRLRFTLAHELGHHELGHGQSWDRADYLQSGDPAERDANLFAAEFLLPRVAVENWKTRTPAVDLESIARLAHDHGVSAQVALYRASDCRLISARAKGALEVAIRESRHLAIPGRSRWPQTHDSLADAQRRERRLPSEAEAAIAAAVRKGVLTPEHAAARLRLEAGEVQEFVDALARVDE
jgi:Zn-dependent peptidase ImmA (M78 family)